jgi:polysaccharide export outer membrane protein
MDRSSLGAIGAVLVLSAFAFPDPHGAIASSPAAAQADLPPPTYAPAARPELQDYRVGPFDVLDVSVLEVDNLSRTVVVSSTGVISLPLSGDFDVSGKTTDQIAAEIAERLGRHDLQHPQVTVTLKDSASLKFTVEGSVLQPGVFPITGPMTLLQGLATAHGPDPIADEKRVSIYREVDGRRISAVYNVDDIRRGKIVDPRIYAGDVIVVALSGKRRVIRDYAPALPLLYLLTLVK